MSRDSGPEICSDNLLTTIYDKFSGSSFDNSGKLGTQEVVFRESEFIIKSSDSRVSEEETIEIPYSSICHFHIEQGYEKGSLSSASFFGPSYIRVSNKKYFSFLLENGMYIVFRKHENSKIEKGSEPSENLEELHICGEKGEEMIKNRIGELKSDSPGFILIRPYYSADGEIRVEGWKEGDSKLNADIDADAKTKGSSIGVEQGGLSVGRSRSKSSIEGDISGKITDNTYSAPIDAFFVLEEKLLIGSQLELELYYDEIDRVTGTRNGLVIQVGGTTYRTEIPEQEYLNEAKSHIKDRVSKSDGSKPNSNSSSSNKLRELKELYDDGVISEEEFESTKSDILDNF